MFLLCGAFVVGIFPTLILKERFCARAGLAFLPGNLGTSGIDNLPSCPKAVLFVFFCRPRGWLRSGSGRRRM